MITVVHIIIIVIIVMGTGRVIVVSARVGRRVGNVVGRKLTALARLFRTRVRREDGCARKTKL